MKRIVTSLTALLLCLGASAAFAQGYTVGFGGGVAAPVSPSAYTDGFKSGGSVGGYLHKSINEHLGIRGEVGWDRVSDGPRFDTTRIAGGLQVTRPGRLEAFGFVTVGAFIKQLDLGSSTLNPDSETDLGVSLGGGLNAFFDSSSTWGLGVELRFNAATQSDNRDTLWTAVTNVQIIRRF